MWQSCFAGARVCAACLKYFLQFKPYGSKSSYVTANFKSHGKLPVQFDPRQVLKVREDSHIYFTNDGRISMAGITTGNVEYVAKSIYAVTG